MISHSSEVNDKAVYVRFLSSARRHVSSVAWFDVNFSDIVSLMQAMRMSVTSTDSGSASKLRKATWLCCLLGCTTASPWTPPSISRWVTFTLYFYPFKVCWQLQNPQTIFAVWLDQQLSPLIGNYISSGFSYQVSESDLRCKIYKRWKWSHRPSLNCISWA